MNFLTDRAWMGLGMAWYAASIMFSIFKLKHPARTHHNVLNYVLVTLGFLFHSMGLYYRGKALGHCPLSNLFEFLMFVSWSVVLVNIVVDFMFRNSFMELFTIPVALIIGCVSFIPSFDTPHDFARNYWVELHAAISLISCGAFGLAGAIGAMYLVQEKLLKSHKANFLMFQFPPVTKLEKINFRLLVLGLVLLTIGIWAGSQGSFQLYGTYLNLANPKNTWSLLVWLVYAFILVAYRYRWIFGKRVAWFSLLSFTFVLLTFWGVNTMSVEH